MASKLHQQQLTRAIKRVILGLGAAPSAPRNLRCRPVSCRAVACAWDPPAEPGHPPFHKLKLERLWQVRRYFLIWVKGNREFASVGHVGGGCMPSVMRPHVLSKLGHLTHHVLRLESLGRRYLPWFCF